MTWTKFTVRIFCNFFYIRISAYIHDRIEIRFLKRLMSLALLLPYQHRPMNHYSRAKCYWNSKNEITKKIYSWQHTPLEWHVGDYVPFRSIRFLEVRFHFYWMYELMDIHWWNHSRCHLRSSRSLIQPLHLDRVLFRVASQPLWNHPNLTGRITQKQRVFLNSELPVCDELIVKILPAENTSTGTFVLLVSSRRSWVPLRRACAYSLATSSKSFGSNGKPLANTNKF